MDKIPDLDISRLCSAAQRSRLALRYPREERVNAVRQVAGKHYSEEGSVLMVPVNLIGMYRTIVGRKLVANNPRALLTTDNQKSRPVVEGMMSWVNKQIVRMNLVESLQRSVDDSLFFLGIIKVAIADPGMAANMGWTIKAGQPYAENVDLDDFVFDIHARRFDQCSFMGHRYRIPLKVAKKMYGAKAKDITASEDLIYNLEGDERISLIGRTTLAGQEEFEDMIDLWEFYLPRHKVIVTLYDGDLISAFSDDSGPNRGKALKIQQWIGPDTGPYHILSMGYLPGNAMPKAPIQDLIDLHMSINEQVRKLIDQVGRQKALLLVQGGADTDGKRVIDASDGEVIRVDRPDNLKAASFGGPDQSVFNLMTAFKELFSWLSGNLDIMGGLGPQAKTAAQDELLAQNSSATVADMQQRAIAHAASVVKSLCWYWHHDPRNVMKVTYQLPGMPNVTSAQAIHPMGQNVNPMTGRPQLARDQSFEDMNITIDPYSLQYQSPQQRLAALNQVVTQIIIPIYQLLQAKGVDFDVQAYLQKVAKLGDMPDLIEIVKMIEPPQINTEGPATQGDMTAPKPANTSREYIRRSQGGASNEGKLMGAGNAMRMQPQMNGQTNGVHNV